MDFDAGTADQLIAACDEAAAALGEQRGPRASATGEALEEFRGPFADSYRRNAAAQLAARNILIGALEDVARQVRFAKTQAEQARQDLKEKQARTLFKLLEEGMVAAGADYLRDRLPGFSAPGELFESEVPRPEVAFPSMVFQLHNWAVSGTPGTSSAVPDALKKAASLIFDQEDAAEPVCQDVVRALDSFRNSCSWVVIDVGTFGPAVSQYNQDDRDDAGKLWQIGQAFSTAGQDGDLAGSVELSSTALALAISPGSVRGEALLKFFETASPVDLEVASKNPAWLTHLPSVSAERIAEWWAELQASGNAANGFTAQQLVLLESAPKVFGSLDGVPALARVHANSIAAVKDIEIAEAQLARLREIGGDSEAREAMLMKEIEYLKRVEAGQVQLYLYNRGESRIIEMLGTPGPDTQRTITYVPGTFTSMKSFYTGGVQDFANYMVGMAPNTVAFVYKDGLFPGENQEEGGEDLRRLLEANDPQMGYDAGRQLAGFQHGMLTDPALQGTEQVGIGHSWGYVNLTSSEIHGAEYDKSLSLSGAGMHEEWEPDEDTSYSNYVYGTDALLWAQRRGLVWDDKIPSEHDAFTNHEYAVPNEGTFWPDSTPIEDHSLPTTNSKDNAELLEDALREVMQ
ncbi:hypothetical protein MUK71_03835 [Arthrobacter zhangbolii]|uniref:Uncharacterized protein n=1 Tax=Arthrobacter zhangbolii TaxID=2886936 RepID=A0A9X1M862_9MICC|nr:MULTISPECIES: hypothetical protein [Arthrobacter]MCC3273228.1 hypothetical protein [Arthrobacter zhangbolii]MCC3295851.1 hypothetical protein [Arthrobacter zhangbolii]MDN3905508.1 hypothetical protein [Arthrobacter sp. YD2]UON92784.1 hypothetical protein MUK71_03835 [Arthrobacter zhangbolii]